MIIDSMSNKVNSTCRVYEQDKQISYAIIFQFCMLITNYTIKHLLNLTDTTTRATISLVFMLLVGVLFLRNINTVFKRNGKIFIMSYTLFLSIFFLNTIIFIENHEYIIESSFWFFLICLPVALYYNAIQNKSIFLNMLLKSAYYQITLGIVFVVISTIRGYVYDMVFSYLIMVPIILLIYKVYKRFSMLDIILIITGIFSIVVIGARGPILSILLFVLALLFINSLSNIYKLSRVMLFFLLFMILVFTIIYFSEFLSLINKSLEYFGINSRTMDLFMISNIDFFTGRTDIYILTIEKILEKPILGYGLVGDRIFLDGSYPHNIFLEILCQFGVITGTFVIIVFIYYWFCGLVLSRNKEERDIAILFFGIGLVQLFISGSYITSSNFWLFMSICVSSVHFKSNK